MVELLPPAPAARVELGRVLATFWARSWAARRRRAVRGPPGGVGEVVRRTGSAAAVGESVPDCVCQLRSAMGGFFAGRTIMRVWA